MQESAFLLICVGVAGCFGRSDEATEPQQQSSSLRGTATCPVLTDACQQADCPTITDLASRTKSGKVTLTWTPVPEAVSYDIWRGLEPTVLTPIAECHLTDYATYLDTDVTDDTTYFYVVYWTTADGARSPPSNMVEATPSGRIIPGGD